MKTKIMGILNVTPDSCYDGGQFFSVEKALARAMQMVEEGADMLDIGGESTRPGAFPVSEEEELQRVIPVIKAIRERSMIPLSIDTMKPNVAEAAVCEGVGMINDVTGFMNDKMISIAKRYQTELCVMHMKGMPQTMQIDPKYEEGVIHHLLNWFKIKTEQLVKAGIKKEKIYLDPGVGFGKSVVDNLKILQNVPTLLELGYPILLGLSRKSFLGKICSKERPKLLPATITANALAALSGVAIIRVHDVEGHKDMLRVLELYKAN